MCERPGSGVNNDRVFIAQMSDGDGHALIGVGPLRRRFTSSELSKHIETARPLPRHWGLAIVNCHLEDLRCASPAKSAHGVPSSLIFIVAEKTRLEQFFGR